MHTIFYFGKLKEREKLEVVSIEGSVIFKWTL